MSVDEKYYEEQPDPDFCKTFSDDFEVHRVGALPLTRPRMIGDIGLRAFFHLYFGALKLMRSRPIDFVWIPIPSFYCALLGRLLWHKTKIPYGIDYIDPWVRDITGRNDWRHKLSNKLARILEPIAVQKASLITGVSYEYYKPVLERNFKPKVTSPLTLHSSPFTISHSPFPYGFDPNDHRLKLPYINYPWPDKGVKPWIYAGAFLPNSRLFVVEMFEAIAELRKEGIWDEAVQMYFVGTGAYPGESILDYAKDSGIADIVFEDRNRFPFLHVLNYLSAADTVMVIGSTEKHYTASKVYQALLSGRPVWAVFHEESSAVQVMKECKADHFLIEYKEGMYLQELRNAMKDSLLCRLEQKEWNPDLYALDKYSARESARKLAEAMELLIGEG